MGASIEEFATCGSSDLNKSTRILALPMATSMSFISIFVLLFLGEMPM